MQIAFQIPSSGWKEWTHESQFRHTPPWKSRRCELSCANSGLCPFQALRSPGISCFFERFLLLSASLINEEKSQLRRLPAPSMCPRKCSISRQNCLTDWGIKRPPTASQIKGAPPYTDRLIQRYLPGNRNSRILVIKCLEDITFGCILVIGFTFWSSPSKWRSISRRYPITTASSLETPSPKVINSDLKTQEDTGRECPSIPAFFYLWRAFFGLHLNKPMVLKRNVSKD